MNIDVYSRKSDGKEDMESSPNLMEVKRDYYIEKLNEVFKLFQLEPVVS